MQEKLRDFGILIAIVAVVFVIVSIVIWSSLKVHVEAEDRSSLSILKV